MSPLKTGVKNIGNNIKEMESTGHDYKQSLAVALNKAYDEHKKKKAKKGKKKGKK